MKLETLYGQPWMIRKDVWHRFHLQAMRELKEGQAIEPPKDAAFPKRPTTDRFGNEIPKLQMVGKTAIVPVQGALMKGATGFDKWLGDVCSYEDINEDIDTGLAQGARAFLFNFSSPGGTVCGLGETAARIAQLGDQGYTTAAFTADLCCSAAYYMAAGCNALFSTPSAFVGSIGTIWETINVVGLLEQLGIGWEVFTSGPLKGTGHPAKELTPEQRDWMQGMVDMMAGEFKAHVTKHRAAVGGQTMQGQIFTGSQATANGLFDANVSGLAECLQLIS